MDRDKLALRVGLFALCALILLSWAWSWLKSFSPFYQPQRFVAQFTDVAGLGRSAPVNIQGVRCGTVEYIDFVNDPEHADHNHKLNVHIKITDPTVSVPEGSRISIQTLGLVGAKYIECVLPRDAAGNIVNGRPLGPNDVLVPPAVEEPVRVELVMNRVATKLDDIVGGVDSEKASKVINNLSQATAKLNHNMDSFKSAAESVTTASNKIAETASKFSHTADDAATASEHASVFFADGDHTLNNVSELATDLRGTAKKVNKLLDNPAFSSDLKESITQARQIAETVRGTINDLSNTLKDKDLREQVLSSLTHLEKATENIKASMQTVDKLSGDQSLRNDIKDAVHTAKDAIGQAKELMDQPDFKSNITSTLTKVRSAAGNVDVAARQLQEILGKHAPLLHMMFGHPGKLPPPQEPNDANSPPVKKVIPLPQMPPQSPSTPGTP